MPAVLPTIVAKVNTEDVQKWELETAVKQAEAKAGSSIAAKIAMMAMTTSNSIKVNPGRRRPVRFECRVLSILKFISIR